MLEPDAPLPAQREPLGVGRRGAGQSTLRDHNLALVLEQVVRGGEPLARADIATQTGLTRATVSALVDALLGAQLVEELPAVSGSRGRPRTPIAPAAASVAGLGLEVNVDYLGAVAVDLAGNVVVEKIERADFRASEPGPVVARLVDVAQRAVSDLSADGVRVCGANLALPGLVDSSSGPLRVAPNLGWRDVDVAALLAPLAGATRGVPGVANEANLAAVAEARARAGEAEPSFVYVSGEIGVGAGLIVNGALYRGLHGWGGEIGHVQFEPGVELEARAGADAIFDAAGLARTADPTELLSGGRAADDALEAAADALGRVLAMVINVVDLEKIVLGGIYGELADRFAPTILERVRAGAIGAPWADISVEAAVAGPTAAMVGGALTALDRVVADPAAWIAS